MSGGVGRTLLVVSDGRCACVHITSAELDPVNFQLGEEIVIHYHLKIMHVGQWSSHPRKVELFATKRFSFSFALSSFTVPISYICMSFFVSFEQF